MTESNEDNNICVATWSYVRANPLIGDFMVPVESEGCSVTLLGQPSSTGQALSPGTTPGLGTAIIVLIGLAGGVSGFVLARVFKTGKIIGAGLVIVGAVVAGAAADQGFRFLESRRLSNLLNEDLSAWSAEPVSVPAPRGSLEGVAFEGDDHVPRFCGEWIGSVAVYRIGEDGQLVDAILMTEPVPGAELPARISSGTG